MSIREIKKLLHIMAKYKRHLLVLAFKNQSSWLNVLVETVIQ